MRESKYDNNTYFFVLNYIRHEKVCTTYCTSGTSSHLTSSLLPCIWKKKLLCNLLYNGSWRFLR